MKTAAILPMLSMVRAILRGLRPLDIETIKTITRIAFPTVPNISTVDLEEWLTGMDPVKLIDVRSCTEFEVSHLPGALNARSASEIRASLPNTAAKVVLYCSVGFRSAKLVASTRNLGFPNVVNLEGSIFQWANEGRPLYSGQVRAEQVHPCSAMWSGLLKTGLAKRL
jgi:rhodanese-related sulfurtransferase